MNQYTRKPKHLFILGAAKCGTSSLYHYLNQHPEIHMAKSKEPLFFESEYSKGTEYYWKTYFSDWNGERLVGEARHRNLYFPYIPPLIAQSFPEAKLLVIVRNPVDRAYSHYLHRKAFSLESLSFEEAVRLDMERIEKERSMSPEEIRDNYIRDLDSSGINPHHRTYVDSGYYAEQIERYFKYFDKKQLHIVFLEDFKKDPEKVFFKILEFLDENLSLIKVNFSIVNKRRSKTYETIHVFLSRNPLLSRVSQIIISKHIKTTFREAMRYFEYELLGRKNMSKATRSWLVSHYYEHNRRLEIVTGRDLSRWDS